MEEGRAFLVGVHIGGKRKNERDYYYNQAVRLNDRVRSTINCWVGRKGNLFLGKSVLMKASKTFRTKT